MLPPQMVVAMGLLKVMVVAVAAVAVVMATAVAMVALTTTMIMMTTTMLSWKVYRSRDSIFADTSYVSFFFRRAPCTSMV